MLTVMIGITLKTFKMVNSSITENNTLQYNLHNN